MDDLTDELLAAIAALPIASTNRLPQLVEDAWPDMVLISLRNWARGIGRDLRRASSAFDAARPDPEAVPGDDHIGSLEECFWRLAAAVEKFDAFVSLAFHGAPLRPEATKPTRLEMRPSADRNKQRLRELGTDAASELIDRRSKIGGTRAELRRNQVMHSLAPLASVDDLAPFIEVVHRNGRIMVNGYNVVRFVPNRWNEGLEKLDPVALFGRRLLEADRALADLRAAVRALIDGLKADGALHEPQWVWVEQTDGMRSLERPTSTGPPAHYEVEFVFRGAEGQESARTISCESLPERGAELALDDCVWQVIESEQLENEHFDGRVVLIPKR